MNDQQTINTTKFSTTGGLLTVLFVNIDMADILKTMLLAVIGTTISFFISLLLKIALNRWQKK